MVSIPVQGGHVADEALEALSSSLGKKEPDPNEKKPAVDKVKVGKQSDLKNETVDVTIVSITVFSQARNSLEIILFFFLKNQNFHVKPGGFCLGSASRISAQWVHFFNDFASYSRVVLSASESCICLVSYCWIKAELTCTSEVAYSMVLFQKETNLWWVV